MIFSGKIAIFENRQVPHCSFLWFWYIMQGKNSELKKGIKR